MPCTTIIIINTTNHTKNGECYSWQYTVSLLNYILHVTEINTNQKAPRHKQT